MTREEFNQRWRMARYQVDQMLILNEVGKLAVPTCPTCDGRGVTRHRLGDLIQHRLCVCVITAPDPGELPADPLNGVIQYDFPDALDNAPRVAQMRFIGEFRRAYHDPATPEVQDDPA